MKGVPSSLVRLSEGLKENHLKTFIRAIKLIKDLNFDNAKVIESLRDSNSSCRKCKSETQIENKVVDEMEDEMESTKILKLAT